MKIKIKDIGTVITGKTPSTSISENFDKKDYMFITPEDLVNNVLITNSSRYISNKGYNSIKSNTISGDSVLIGCIGSDMGNVAMVNCDCATNQQINSITNFNKNFNSKYIYYYLSLQKEYFQKIAGGTTTPILTKKTLSNITLNIPEKKIQDDISKTLYYLDNKIFTNKKIQNVLESIINKIYSYWFIQFDFPNSKGLPYRTSNGEMVHSIKMNMEIPKDWKIINLKDIADIIPGVTYDKNDLKDTKSDDDIELLRATNIQNKKIILSDTYIIPKKIIDNKKLLNPLNILVATSSGSKHFLGKFAPIYFKKDMTFGAFCTKLEALDEIYKYFILSYVNSPIYKAEIKKSLYGTSINNLNKSDIEKFRVIIPKKDILIKFNSTVSPMYDKICNLESEIEFLESLKEFLLPLLMNGQVGFNDSNK